MRTVIVTGLPPAKGPVSGETEMAISPARDVGAERRVREVRRARPRWKRRDFAGVGTRATEGRVFVFIREEGERYLETKILQDGKLQFLQMIKKKELGNMD